MANLNGQNIGLNYKGILNLGSTINIPLSTTLQSITDGDGNTTPLQLATNRIALGTATGTGLLNFPDAGTTAVDGISFGSGISMYKADASSSVNIAFPNADFRVGEGGWFAMYRYGGNTPLNTYSALGTKISPTLHTSGSVIGRYTANAFADINTWIGVHRIEVQASENHTPTAMGSTITYKKTITGSIAYADYLGIDGNNLWNSAGSGFRYNLYPLTGSSAINGLNITQTWNTTGNPTAIFANITNTASGATSNLMDLQVGGVSMFRVNKLGGIFSSGVSTFSNNVQFNTLIDCNSANNFRLVVPGVTKTLLVNHDYSNTPSASAILELQATTQGFLPPRMTTAQRTAIASPATGLQVYDTDFRCQMSYNGVFWSGFRYNDAIAKFEGYDGTNWGHLN